MDGSNVGLSRITKLVTPPLHGAAFQFFPHIVGRHDLGNNAVNIQPGSVVAGISLIPFCLDLALDIELVVIQAAPVRSDSEIVAHVCCTQSLFTGHQSLIELLSMSGADNLL